MTMSLNPRLENPLTDRLVTALLSLETRQEAYELLEDLCTVAELRDLSMRLEVARLLAAGEKYERIEALTGASSATISRVKRCLRFGADGYVKILARLPEVADEVE